MAADDAFQELVSGIDYPMFIVTVAKDGDRAGCLVGFVTQASIDPPRMIVMISKANHTYQLARTADELVVHFLGAGNTDLAKLFGEQTGDEVDKFAQCEWSPSPGGLPVVGGTLGWVECRILERFEGGDHVGHLVEPVYGASTDEKGQLGFQAVRSLRPGHGP
jgi:flavin reductase (DIM6/NTAB) family NADH-FMN oxidoreductase RutF